jgi:hypothetical protein
VTPVFYLYMERVGVRLERLMRRQRSPGEALAAPH